MSKQVGKGKPSKYKGKGISFHRMHTIELVCDKIRLFIDKRAKVRIIDGYPVIHYSFFDKVKRSALRKQFTESQCIVMMNELR